MTLLEKIIELEKILLQPKENYADSFKEDIYIYFDEYFSIENKELSFLNMLHTKEEIENLINRLTSRFVMKFDAESESEKDFIHEFFISFIPDFSDS